MPLDIDRPEPNVLVVTRRFRAPPERVFAAHVDPEIIPRWLTGMDGWSMPVCINEARPGGAIRYEWREDATGQGFHLTGRFEEVEPPANGRPGRIVHVEQMHMPDPTPENHCVTTFAPDGTGTLMTLTMTLPDAQTVDQMLETGMTAGMEDGYSRIDGVVLAAA